MSRFVSYALVETVFDLPDLLLGVPDDEAARKQALALARADLYGSKLRRLVVCLEKDAPSPTRRRLHFEDDDGFTLVEIPESLR